MTSIVSGEFMAYLVKHYMRKIVPTVNGNNTGLETAQEMMASGQGLVIVLRDGQPAGMITEHDFMDKVVMTAKDPSKITGEAIMSFPLVCVDPDDDLLDASKLMTEHGIHALAVIRDGIIYGTLSARDIAVSLGDYVDRSTRDILRWAAPPFSR
jgi:CBS domain-containing protein